MFRFVLAIAGLLGLWATPPPLPDRPAIPLITTSPVTPPEAAAELTKHPTARLQLAINEIGRVTAVKVIKLEPTSRFDQALKRAIEEAVQSWRFGPALRAGQSVATEQELAMTFVPAERTAPDFEQVNRQSSDLDRLDDLAYARRITILSWPKEQLLAEQQRVSAKAEALLDKSKRYSFADEHFEVVTDSGDDAKQAKAIASSMSASYATVNRVIGRRLTAYANSGLVKVYVFRTQDQYRRLCAEENGGAEWSSGFYHPSGVIAFHIEVPTLSYVYSVLIHESVHAAMDRHIVRTFVQLPRWLDEGFASYLGNSDIVDGQIIPGRQKHRKELLPWAGVSGTITTSAGGDIETVKRAARYDKELSLLQLVTASPETFYGDGRRLYYAEGWMLVHFLRHAEPTWEDREFPRFMLYVAEGFEAVDALKQVYGNDLAALDTKFKLYMKKF